MKPYIAIALATAVLPMAVYAQGTVNFSSANANQTIRDMGTGQAVGSGFTAGLYWGAQGSSADQLVLLGPTWPVTAGNGFIINGGTRTTGSATAPGAVGTFQVRAWDGGYATYDDALAAGTGLAGVSAVFDNPTGNPNAVPPGTPAALTGWTSPVLVTVAVPEPSTIALAALGLGGLVLLRRRK